METFWYALYNALVIPFLRIVLLFVKQFNKKVRVGLKGRERLFEDLELAAAALQGPEPRIWIHNSSMGEFEQAKPVVEKLKSQIPGCSVIVSFFSPSGFEHVKDYKAADILCYLPFDSRGNAERFVRILKPDVGVVVRHDIWPNHIRVLKRSGVPAVLINFSLRQRQHLRSWLFCVLFRFVFRQFDRILAVSQETFRTGCLYGLERERLEVAGDTRYDQVIRRTRDAERVVAPLRPFIRNRPCLVFGSTWPSDEAVVFPVISGLRDEKLSVWTILVPHEPTKNHLLQIESRCEACGLKSRRLSRVESGKPDEPFDVLLVDRVGILADLYAISDIAFVGGGFGPGVHSVLEPAAFGIPVFFGPRCRNSFEAGQLKKRGGGFIVRNPDSFLKILVPLLKDRSLLKHAGEKSMDLVKENIGATDRIVARLEEIIDRRD
jgi:3-deoxy-D-manno-octulosonic-acid transferase